MPSLPFSVFKRKGREFYYVQFKNEQGGYLPAVSTKQTTEASAIEVSFKWLREGKPRKNNNNQLTNISVSLMNLIRTLKTPDEARLICNELKRKGFIKAFILSESVSSVKLIDYLINFWDYDQSPYVKEKLRKNHGIHRNYVTGQKLSVEKYWKPFFGTRLLGEITQNDIDRFIDSLDSLAVAKPRTYGGLSSGRKNIIIKAGTIPLRWAFSKEMIEKDVAKGITWFSVTARKRLLLSPELVRDLFTAEWTDERAKLANMVAAITGLRSGEIAGLRICDIGEDYLNVQCSWNPRDKLKTTKTNEARTVLIPFPQIINGLRELASLNPHNMGADGYVFWSEKISTKPIEARTFVTGLRRTLVQIGMSEEAASGYEFHGWRHFFTSYMRDKLDFKLLKSQTGHKTNSMIIHYSDHLLPGEKELVRQAQMDVFGALLPLGAI